MVKQIPFRKLKQTGKLKLILFHNSAAFIKEWCSPIQNKNEYEKLEKNESIYSFHHTSISILIVCRLIVFANIKNEIGGF